MERKVQADIDALLAQAEQRATAHDWEGAAALCIKACALTTDDAYVFDKLGWYFSRAKQYENAIKVYRTLMEHEPEVSLWPYMLGYQYYTQRQWREALTGFGRAVALRETYLVAWYRKGYAHLQIGEERAAKQAFEQCVRIWRDLSVEQRQREAMHYAKVCFQLGKMDLSSRRPDYAEEWFAAAVSYDSSDAYIHYDYGKALFKNGKFEAALEQFHLAEHSEPRKDYILVYIARTHIALKQYDTAEAVLQRIPPGQRKAYVWFELGRMYLAQGRFQPARDALQKAVRADGRNHNYQYLLGQAHQACGDQAAAAACYQRAIQYRQQRYRCPFPEASARLARTEACLTGYCKDMIRDEQDRATTPDGFIVSFHAERGFGFIEAPGAAKIFFHISSVGNPDLIEVGARVTFTTIPSVKGPRAVQVSVV